MVAVTLFGKSTVALCYVCLMVNSVIRWVALAAVRFVSLKGVVSLHRKLGTTCRKGLKVWKQSEVEQL